MTPHGAKVLGAAGVIWLVCMAPVLAQAPTEANSADHRIVYELGWEGDWSRNEGLHHGGTFAFEVTPIERWLELEVGVSAIHASNGTELPIDVLAKKPWPISSKFEFMVGLGPELVHVGGPNPDTFWGLSAVLDFMFWPKKNLGWYVEPGYERTFRSNESSNGMAVAAGLLIGR